MKEYSDNLSGLNAKEILENQTHKSKMESIEDDYNKKIEELQNAGLAADVYMAKQTELQNAKELKETEEYTRHNKKIAEIRNGQEKVLSDEKYQNQLVAFLSLMGLYEQYTGETDSKAKGIASAFLAAFDNLDEDTKKKFIDAMQGAENGLTEKENSLFAKAEWIAGSVINTYKKIFDEHSPSKIFKKIFAYTLEGGENGLDDEAPNLYKQADDVASTFTERMQAGVSADGLVSKMRSAVNAGQAMLRSKFTADVNHNVELMSEDNERKYSLKGDIHTSINIDGRPFTKLFGQRYNCYQQFICFSQYLNCSVTVFFRPWHKNFDFNFDFLSTLSR